MLSENFDFWQRFRFLTKISIFDKNFDFWEIFRFLTNISIFDKNLDFWQKFCFSLDSSAQRVPHFSTFFGGFDHFYWTDFGSVLNWVLLSSLGGNQYLPALWRGKSLMGDFKKLFLFCKKMLRFQIRINSWFNFVHKFVISIQVRSCPKIMTSIKISDKFCSKCFFTEAHSHKGPFSLLL